MSQQESGKHFIQAFMANPILSKKDAQVLSKRAQQTFKGEISYQPEFVSQRVSNMFEHVQCVNVFIETVVLLPEFLVSINKSLEPLGMKITRGRLEQDGTEWVGLVNTVPDAAARRASKLSMAHQEYFKHVVSKVIVYVFM